MIIKIDSREPAVLLNLVQTCLKGSKHTLQREALPVGDFSIGKEGNEETPQVIIERKTASDLAASVRDGRFASQRERLLTCGVPPLVLLENQASTRAVDATIVSGAVENLIFKYNVKVLPTIDMEHTCKTICSIADKYEDGRFSASPSPSQGRVVVMQSHAGLKNGQVYLRQLTCVQGVSVARARAIADLFPCTGKLVAALNERGCSAIEPILINNRRLGKALAQRIVDAYL